MRDNWAAQTNGRSQGNGKERDVARVRKVRYASSRGCGGRKVWIAAGFLSFLLLAVVHCM
jgi:hypothetical protein